MTTIDTTRHEDAITAATQDITDVDVDPTPRLATLQPNVTTAADRTHTKEDDPAVQRTTPSVTSAA